MHCNILTTRLIKKSCINMTRICTEFSTPIGIFNFFMNEGNISFMRIFRRFLPVVDNFCHFCRFCMKPRLSTGRNNNLPAVDFLCRWRVLRLRPDFVTTSAKSAQLLHLVYSGLRIPIYHTEKSHTSCKGGTQSSRPVERQPAVLLKQ